MLEEVSVFEATLSNGTNPMAKIHFERFYNTFIQILADSANATILKYAKKLWTVSCLYLGIYLASARSFKFSFDVARSKFYRAFNSIFGKVSRLATETVILNLLSSNCLPVLLYCIEACPLLSRDLNSMSFAVNRVLMKIFCSRSSAVVEECRTMFGVPSIIDQIHTRMIKFLRKFCESDN